MKKWIAMVLLLILVCSFTGCGSTLEADNPTVARTDVTEPAAMEHESTEMAEQENISVYPADTDVFYSLESFLDYAAAAESGDGYADLASLEYFYLPTGIPEGYSLYKITALKNDIGFWYIPDEAFFEGSFFAAEGYRENFKFISPRVYYEWYKGHEGMITRMADTDLLMLYLPEAFIPEEEFAMQEREALLQATKFFRTEEGTFENRLGEEVLSFVGEDTLVISDTLEMTFLEARGDSNQFTFQLHNPTDKIYAYSKGCRFEELKGERWSTVAYGVNNTLYDVGKLYPDWAADISYEVHRGHLEPGTYRIVIEFQPVEEGDAVLTSCQFVVE